MAANLSGLGCKVTLVGLLGADAAAERLRQMLAAARVTDGCLTDERRPTTTKTRVMAGNQQVVRLDEEDGAAIDAAVVAQLLQRIDARLSSAGAVILSDYGKGMFRQETVTQTIIQACRQKGVPVFVDPKGSDWQRYNGATCVTPNTAELELVHGSRLDGEAD
ncbi:bifunctional heptose 7-phosphate kinase/heptose 1-phosphate adenyltransferase [Desulfosarcina cetonica]|uniref:bifunctional heptose 7-phosphate kinase/heptose 1-phosphate adenyltransferase n=1 Tax=Desulfosarcina cetonica TaxID=90730 RepID=UPI0006D0B94F|nr:PfkB family carbohydrate kinase [Desulfosarcina cetonica]